MLSFTCDESRDTATSITNSEAINTYRWCDATHVSHHTTYKYYNLTKPFTAL